MAVQLGEMEIDLPGDINNGTVVKGLEILCSLFLQIFGPFVLQLLEYKVAPDRICCASGLCYDEQSMGMCHLFPVPNAVSEQPSLLTITETEKKLVSYMIIQLLPWICWIPRVKQLSDTIITLAQRLDHINSKASSDRFVEIILFGRTFKALKSILMSS